MKVNLALVELFWADNLNKRLRCHSCLVCNFHKLFDLDSVLFLFHSQSKRLHQNYFVQFLEGSLDKFLGPQTSPADSLHKKCYQRLVELFRQDKHWFTLWEEPKDPVWQSVQVSPPSEVVPLGQNSQNCPFQNSPFPHENTHEPSSKPAC